VSRALAFISLCSCEYCLRGLENLCPYAQFTGFHVDGGYAEYMLAKADYVLPLPGIFPMSASPPCYARVLWVTFATSLRCAAWERLGLVGLRCQRPLVIQVARFWGVRSLYLRVHLSIAAMLKS